MTDQDAVQPASAETLAEQIPNIRLRCIDTALAAWGRVAVICEHHQNIPVGSLVDAVLGVRDEEIAALRQELGMLKQAAEIVVRERWFERLAKAASWQERAERAEAERDQLRAHILDIDAHATPYGDIPEDPGYVGLYLLTAGALHRALGTIGHSAPKCQAEAAVARAENLRDKWLAWPVGDMHHAAGLMLARYLDGTAYGSNEPRPAALDESEAAAPPPPGTVVDLAAQPLPPYYDSGEADRG